MATFGVDAGELQVHGIYLINQTLHNRIWLQGRESPCIRTCRRLSIPFKFSLQHLRAYGRRFGGNYKITG